MADIFISYSKSDRLIVEMLAADFEASGWSVWFDRELTSGDSYRDEIAVQLANARSVIVVWTVNSITSDFVRAEAGRAKADNKLIPAKASDVEYGDIPLPFGEMHTEPVENTELVRGAIVSLLAKPVVAPSMMSRMTGALRYELLTWFGIIGAAITTFSGAKALLEIANWLRRIMDEWNALTHAFWHWLLSFVDIQIHAIWSPLFTFLAFATSTILGVYLSQRFRVKHNMEVFQDRAALGPLSWPYVIALSVFATIGPVVFFLMMLVASDSTLADLPAWWSRAISNAAYYVLPALLVLYSHDRLSVLIFSVLFFSAAGLIASHPINTILFGGQQLAEMSGADIRYPPMLSALIVPAIHALALVILPARRLAQRFIFMLIGFALLLGLNEVSKLNLAQYLNT